MKIFKKEPNFNFMKNRLYAFIISGLVILAGIGLFLTRSFNLGIDFTGGTMIEVSFKEKVAIDDLRAKLKAVGLGKSTIQRIANQDKFFIKTFKEFDTEGEENKTEEHSGFTALIKEALMSAEEKAAAKDKVDLNDASEKVIMDFLAKNGVPDEDAKDSAQKLIGLTTENTKGLISNFSEIEGLDLKKRVLSILKEKAVLGSFIFLSTETVGPQVGHDMQGKATRAAIYAMIGMLIYIGFRFKFIYGFAAVITLLHDVLVTLSFILLFNVEVSLPVVAGILTLVGYSLNDTIVIFDRVRDNVKLMKKETATLILDRSINQTISRTIVTSGTTLCTVLALFFFGGEVIHSFSFTLMVGVIIGTYSSIFQSCAWLKIWEKHFIGKKKVKA
ncbi:MAG: protein translocase subunit SecF [bacterium]|nr:protein translocase subunit SecF [bacterium]